MKQFDLEKALETVKLVRERPRKTKAQKLWYEVFDDLYSERLQKGETIENILMEVLDKK